MTFTAGACACRTAGRRPQGGTHEQESHQLLRRTGRPSPARPRARTGRAGRLREHRHVGDGDLAPGKEYDAVHNEAIALVKELLGVPDNFKVLLLQGGGNLQFAMLPMNILHSAARPTTSSPASGPKRRTRRRSWSPATPSASSPRPRRRSTAGCRAPRRSRSTGTPPTSTSARTTRSSAPSGRSFPRPAASRSRATCRRTSCGGRSTSRRSA